MNRFFSFLFKYLIYSKAIVSKSTVFYKSAKIINISKRKENIIIGKHTHLRGELLLYGHGGQIKIGDYCYIGEGTRIWSARKIEIGNRVLIAHNVNIHDNISHPIDHHLRHSHFKKIITTGHPLTNIDLKEEEIYIEDDVWIGFNVTILRGVRIGKGAIIGAASVVTKDIAPFATVVGNPAREVS